MATIALDMKLKSTTWYLIWIWVECDWGHCKVHLVEAGFVLVVLFFLHHAEESQLGRNCQSETQTVQNVIWERKRKHKELENFRCLCLCVHLCLCLRQGRFHGELNKNYCVCACACVSSEKKAFHATISNANRTEWSPVRSVWFSLDRIALRFWLRLWLRLRH